MAAQVAQREGCSAVSSHTDGKAPCTPRSNAPASGLLRMTPIQTGFPRPGSIEQPAADALVLKDA